MDCLRNNSCSRDTRGVNNKALIHYFRLGLIVCVALLLFGCRGLPPERDHQVSSVFELCETKNYPSRLFEPFEPVFIFIPGILGSELELVRKEGGNKPIFGQFSIDLLEDMSEELIFNPNQVINPKLLLKINLPGELKPVDVYETFVSMVNTRTIELNRKQRLNMLVFSYDWRADIRISARRFDICMNKKETQEILQGRNVYIIAHSMGGLVARWWYGEFYYKNIKATKKAYNYNISEIFFVGTPHHGSISMVCDILYGYGSCVMPDTLRKIINALVKDLRREAFLTFPSTYQLFPRRLLELDKLEKANKEECTEFSTDKFIEVREAYERLKLKVSTAEKRVYEKAVKIYKKETFLELILEHLQNAQCFRKELEKMPRIEKVRNYYSSDGRTTPERIPVFDEYNEVYEPCECSGYGDGRVLGKIARNGGAGKENQAIQLFQVDHLGLLISGRFFHDLQEEQKNVTEKRASDWLVTKVALFPLTFLKSLGQAAFWAVVDFAKGIHRIIKEKA